MMHCRFFFLSRESIFCYHPKNVSFTHRTIALCSHFTYTATTAQKRKLLWVNRLTQSSSKLSLSNRDVVQVRDMYEWGRINFSEKAVIITCSDGASLMNTINKTMIKTILFTGIHKNKQLWHLTELCERYDVI